MRGIAGSGQGEHSPSCSPPLRARIEAPRLPLFILIDAPYPPRVSDVLWFLWISVRAIRGIHLCGSIRAWGEWKSQTTG